MRLCSYGRYLGHDVWKKLGSQQLLRTGYLGFFRKSAAFETVEGIAATVCPMQFSQLCVIHYGLGFTVTNAPKQLRSLLGERAKTNFFLLVVVAFTSTSSDFYLACGHPLVKYCACTHRHEL